MYESFYGLHCKPFQLNPDPRFYFASKQHSRASAYLEYGMHQNEGFIVITGEVGAGKTTIVRSLLDGLDPDKVLAANLVSTQVDAQDTLRLVGAAFGIRMSDLTKSEMLMTLEAFLIDATRQGKRCLLVVDEAQNLSQSAVEELRMLSNFQYGSFALLQSFLVGQPEFRQILSSSQMEQLRQRVIASCHIGPLDSDETQAYVEHRLKCAGSTGSPQFASDAFAEIHKAAGGIPRRINTICDRLLLLGFLAERTAFSAADVLEVARELREETRVSTEPARPPVVETQVQPIRRIPSPVPAPVPDMSGQDPAQLVASLAAAQVDDRLLHIEQTLMRLERLESATLVLLQQLVDARAGRPASTAEKK